MRRFIRTLLHNLAIPHFPVSKFSNPDDRFADADTFMDEYRGRKN